MFIYCSNFNKNPLEVKLVNVFNISYNLETKEHIIFIFLFFKCENEWCSLVSWQHFFSGTIERVWKSGTPNMKAPNFLVP